MHCIHAIVLYIKQPCSYCAHVSIFRKLYLPRPRGLDNHVRKTIGVLN